MKSIHWRQVTTLQVLSVVVIAFCLTGLTASIRAEGLEFDLIVIEPAVEPEADQSDSDEKKAGQAEPDKSASKEAVPKTEEVKSGANDNKTDNEKKPRRQRRNSDKSGNVTQKDDQTKQDQKKDEKKG